MNLRSMSAYSKPVKVMVCSLVFIFIVVVTRNFHILILFSSNLIFSEFLYTLETLCSDASFVVSHFSLLMFVYCHQFCLIFRKPKNRRNILRNSLNKI